MSIKDFIRSHRSLLAVARFVLHKKVKKPIVLSISDIDIMIDDWCHILPHDYDCVIGIPRGGLMVACQIALNLAESLATPEGFMRGEVWISHSLNKTKDFKRVLVVEDAITSGKALFDWVERLRLAFPDCVFETASLVICSDSVEVDYFYIYERCGLYSSFALPSVSGVCYDSLPEV